jgi:glutathione S-transferase
MTAAVRVHGYPVSTWTRTARMTCIEKGIDYELVPVARGSAEHAALHPYLRMPILELADGTTIFETLAICGHLDEAFPGPSLQPQGAAARARMRTWMGVCGDYLFTQVVQGIPRKRAPSDDELATARAALQAAESLLVPGDAFLAGDEISLADLYLAPQLANCAEKAPAVLDGLDGLGAWAARMAQRESFRRT